MSANFLEDKRNIDRFLVNLVNEPVTKQWDQDLRNEIIKRR